MTELSKNVKFKNELRLSLKGSFSDLILKSDALKNIGEIKHIISTCEEHKIDPLDIREKNTTLTEDIGFAEGIIRDAMGKRYDSILSRVLNKIIVTLLATAEEPTMASIAEIQKTLKSDIRLSTKDKIAAINASLYSLELKPFVRFRLVSVGFEKQLAKIKFKVDVKCRLKDLGVNLGEPGKILPGIIVIELVASLKEVETTLGTQPINLQLGRSSFEIKLPGWQE